MKNSPAYRRRGYVGLQVDVSRFSLVDGQFPSGDYTFEEVIRDENGVEFKCKGGYALSDDGIITHVKRMSWQRMDGKAGIVKQAYVLLRDTLDVML